MLTGDAFLEPFALPPERRRSSRMLQRSPGFRGDSGHHTGMRLVRCRSCCSCSRLCIRRPPRPPCLPRIGISNVGVCHTWRMAHECCRHPSPVDLGKWLKELVDLPHTHACNCLRQSMRKACCDGDVSAHGACALLQPEHKVCMPAAIIDTAPHGRCCGAVYAHAAVIWGPPSHGACSAGAFL